MKRTGGSILSGPAKERPESHAGRRRKEHSEIWSGLENGVPVWKDTLVYAILDREAGDKMPRKRA